MITCAHSIIDPLVITAMLNGMSEQGRTPAFWETTPELEAQLSMLTTLPIYTHPALPEHTIYLRQAGDTPFTGLMNNDG